MRLVHAQVEVAGGVDQTEQWYVEFCRHHSGLDGSDRPSAAAHTRFEELLSMYGTAKLMKDLQTRQLKHMLDQHQHILSKLKGVAAIKEVKVSQAGLVQHVLQLSDHCLSCRSLHWRILFSVADLYAPSFTAHWQLP